MNTKHLYATRFWAVLASLLLLRLGFFSAAHADVMITEVLTNAGSADDNYEFIELYNIGDTPVDVAGWILTDGDSTDTIGMYDEAEYGVISDPDITLSTEIPAYGYGVIIDPEYTLGPDGEVFDFPAGTVVMSVVGSTSLGNGFSDSTDPVTLYRELGGSSIEIVSTYGTPNLSNPSNPSSFDDNSSDTLPILTYATYSVERRNTASGDVEGNWELSSRSWGTPGGPNTKSTGNIQDIVITEVFANPSGGTSRGDDNPARPEDTQEFVELLNSGSEPVDVGNWYLTDGDSFDRLFSYAEAGGGTITDPDPLVDTTVIPVGGVAVILDPNYAEGDQVYDFPAGTVLLATSGSQPAIGSNIATSDPITLFTARAGNLSSYRVANIAATYGTPRLSDLSSYTRLDDNKGDGIPFNPGTNYTVERIDPAAGDTESNWEASNVPLGTPGDVPAAVPNQSPIADAGPDQAVDEGILVQLDGSGSSDPDGDILSYSWIQTAGTTVTLSNPNSVQPTFTAPEVTADETLTFDVTVADGRGGADTDVVDVTVYDVPPIPGDWTITLPDDYIAGTIPNTIYFNGVLDYGLPPVVNVSVTDSVTDEDGNITISFATAMVQQNADATLVYTWYWGDGAVDPAAAASHTFTPGTYSVYLEVRDTRATPTITDDLIGRRIIRVTDGQADTAQVTVNAVGDIGKYDISAQNYSEIAALFAPGGPLTGDLQIGNLETTVETPGAVPHPEKRLHFEMEEADVADLQVMGFDDFSIANNHAIDFGEDGLIHTVEYLDGVGLQAAGAGIREYGAVQPMILQVNGMALGIVSLSDITGAGEYNVVTGDYGISPEYQYDATEDRFGVAHTRNVDAAVQYLDSELDVDAVIVLMHGGKEYRSAPPAGYRALELAAIDAGADVVVSHGPHVVQGPEVYEPAADRVGLIYHSTGNFLFRQEIAPSKTGRDRRDTTDSMVANVTLTREGIAAAWIVPIKRVRIAGELRDPAAGGADTRIIVPEVATGSDATDIINMLAADSSAYGTVVAADGTIVLP